MAMTSLAIISICVDDKVGDYQFRGGRHRQMDRHTRSALYCLPLFLRSGDRVSARFGMPDSGTQKSGY